MSKAGRWIIVILGVLNWNVGSVLASEAVLEVSQLGVKVGHIGFVDDSAEELDVDSGLLLGLEAYEYLDRGVYLGFEVGWAKNEGMILLGGREYDTQLTYIPVELNAKWVRMILPHASLGFGLGPSLNYAKIEISGPALDSSEDEWFWGGQVFAEFNVESGPLYFGLNGKYQQVENDLQNWGAGGQIGYRY